MSQYHSRVRVGGLPTPPNDMYGYHGGNGQYGCNPARKIAYESNVYHGPAPSMAYNSQAQYGNMPLLPHPGLLRPTHFVPGTQATLPPIADVTRRLPSKSDYQQQNHESRRQVPTTKQEKASLGGVAQDLDYKMDEMTDYVAEMALEIIMPRSKVIPTFRKSVSSILLSTRLPRPTILLGLKYLAKRLLLMNTAILRPSEQTVWHMLTVCLLLGSKFLDDNTFQNQSWSEVSGIPVQDLNTMEREWLQALNWNLHINGDEESDFHCWLASWDSWKAARKLRLAPLSQLDTVSRRQSHYNGRNDLSPIPHHMYGREQTPPVYQHQSRFVSRPWSRPTSEYSPLSAPESGPNTPIWMMQLPNSGLPPSFVWHGGASNASMSHGDMYAGRASQRTAQAAYPSYPSYNAHPQAYWGAHPAGCTCHYCYTSEPYFHQSRGYSQQAVVG